MAKFDPFLSLDCARVEGVGAQSKERKGSNFAIWQPCFQGLISPTAFSELLRITRPGGIVMWNICARYEEIGGDFERYDDIVGGLG